MACRWPSTTTSTGRCFVNPTHQFTRQGLDNPDAVYFNAYLREGIGTSSAAGAARTADLSFQVMGGDYTPTPRPTA